jgi:hypothetical protein
MGQRNAAREIVERLRAITPLVIPELKYLRNPQHRELLLSGLRLAAGESDMSQTRCRPRLASSRVG